MLKGKLPTNVKAILCLNNGARIEGRAITPHLLEYALNNREHFNFVYQGDVYEPVREPRETARDLDVEVSVDRNPRFSKTDLMRMNKGPLQELCDTLRIVLEGDPTKEDIVDMILMDQGTR